jgi:hypothetical protein
MVDVTCVSIMHLGVADIDIFISSARSVSNLNMQSMYEMFKSRLKAEILRDITYGFQDQIALRVKADIFGETYINVSISGGHPAEFITPSFADSTFLPVIATNHDHFNHITHDVDALLSEVVSYSDQYNNYMATPLQQFQNVKL